MKKILFLAEAVIAIVLTSCSNEQKAKANVKDYISDKCYKIEFFTYNDNGTVSTFDTKYNLLHEADSLFKEAEGLSADANRFLQLYKSTHNIEYLSYVDSYAKESRYVLDKAYSIVEKIAETKADTITCKTATIGYIDNNGNYCTDTFVLNDNMTVNCNANDYGISLDKYLVEAKQLFKF